MQIGKNLPGNTEREFSRAGVSQVPFICFFKGFSGSNHL